jgi:hypothetical protein
MVNLLKIRAKKFKENNYSFTPELAMCLYIGGDIEPDIG